MAPESIYSSYNSPAFSILKKSSSSTSPPKFVFFASNAQSPQPIQSRQSDIQELKDCLLHWQQTISRTITQEVDQTIDSVFSTHWAKVEEERLAKKRAEEEQARQVRIAETARLAEEYRLLAEQQAEEVRLTEERAELLQQQQQQQQAEQTPIEKTNTKLHNHVQDHHQKKPAKPASEIAEPSPSEAAVTPPSTPKAEPVKITTAEPTPPATPPPPSEPALMLTSPIIQSETTAKNSLPDTPPTTPSATPRKQISWAKIASRPVIAPKPSRLPVPTPKITPKALETAAITCPPTPPPTPPTPVPKHQHQSYLTIDDLYRMFAEKPKPIGLSQHQIRRSSPPSVGPRQSIQRGPIQTSITSYFRPAANESKPISQGSKTPNPRSFHQLMTAEPSRITPSKWSEKSSILPYKTSTFSRPHTSEISSILPYKMPGISRFQLMAASCKSTARLPASIQASTSLSHSCRICCGTFGSNNGLHRHLRANHFGHASRHGSEKHRAPGRNVMARRSLTS
ncbi:hypothetical protein G7Y79_00102g101500 [Physcia stellaris]|nr:hypothetical protein G7Y79_00102g101500 [Physcia stellaris]